MRVLPLAPLREGDSVWVLLRVGVDCDLAAGGDGDDEVEVEVDRDFVVVVVELRVLFDAGACAALSVPKGSRELTRVLPRGVVVAGVVVVVAATAGRLSAVADERSLLASAGIAIRPATSSTGIGSSRCSTRSTRKPRSRFRIAQPPVPAAAVGVAGAELLVDGDGVTVVALAAVAAAAVAAS